LEEHGGFPRECVDTNRASCRIRTIDIPFHVERKTDLVSFRLDGIKRACIDREGETQRTSDPDFTVIFSKNSKSFNRKLGLLE